MADDFDPKAFLAEGNPSEAPFDPKAFLRDEPGSTPTWGQTALDVGKQVLTRPIKGAETLATGPAQLLGLAGRGVEYLFPGDPERRAEQQKIRELAGKQGGAKGISQYLPKPETKLGEYVGSVAEMGPAALASPGSLLTRAAGAVGAGVGSQGLGDLGEAVGGPYASEVGTAGRIAGAVIGGAGASGIAHALESKSGTIPKDLARAIIRDGDTPETLNQKLAEARQVRPEATLADVGGENVRGILERVAQTPGAGRTVVVPHLEARQKQQMERIASDLTGATGTRQSAFRAIEDTMQQRKTAASPLYERAYGEGDNAIWSPELERLSGAPFVQAAMRRAVSNWKNSAIADGYGAMNPSQIDRGGLLTFGKSVPVFPNLQFWDYTKQQLDGMTSAALRAGQNQKARTLTRLTQQLRAGLDGHPQIPGTYAEARNAWSGSSRYIDSIEDGRSIFNRNITAEEFAHNFNALTEAEKEGMRIGVVGALRQKMASNPAKMPDLTRELRSPDMRAKMAAIMPTPEAAQKFERALDFEVRSSELAHRGLAGSQTYRRLMEKVDAENIFGEAALHLIAPHHSTRGMFINLFKTLSKPVRDTLRSRMDARLADILTDTSGTALPSLPPRSGPRMPRALQFGTVAGTAGFKKGGRVTKTFRYQEGGEVKQDQSGPPPPPNQQVEDYIAGQRAAFQPNYAGETYEGTLSGPAYAATQPGMSGYFDLVDGNRIIPHAFTPQQVAEQAGVTTGQLGAGFGPSGGYDNVAYNIPNDQGGFFDVNADSLPTVGAGLSTNNWRLLGMGPGYIMRQGNIINTRDPATRSGLPAGYDTSYSDTAESGAYIHRFVAPGAALTGRNKWDAYYWPGSSVTGYTRWPMGTNVKRGGRIKGLPSIRR